MADTEREAFEAKYRGSLDLDRFSEHGGYVCHSTHCAWRAWNDRGTALDSRPTEVGEKPVAYAVVSIKGGIHKLCITRSSAERKAAVWQEEWPDNGCTVRPLVFGDLAPSHTTNKEK